MLREPPVTGEWVAGLCRTIKTTYYVPDMDERERRAWIAGFHDALRDIPASFSREAARRVLRKKTSRPSPADVRNEAEQLRRTARDRLRLDRPRPPEPRRTPVSTPEGREAVQRQVEALNRRMGRVIASDRIERCEAPTFPRPMSDDEIRYLRGLDQQEHVAAFRASNGVSSPEDVRRARDFIRERRQQ